MERTAAVARAKLLATLVNSSGSSSDAARMDCLSETMCSLLALAASYKPGTIIAAEQVVDGYLTQFQGCQARLAAMDALLYELALPEHRACNRGVLFGLIELHLERRHRDIVRQFQ